MFPLKERKLIRGAAAHVKAGLGVGADYRANYQPLYAPFDGVVSVPYGAYLLWPVNQGGKWIRVTCTNGDVIEFGHNSKWLVTSGRVVKGQQIAVTGNTGKITTVPHCHAQIFIHNVRVDPEKYPWDDAETGSTWTASPNVPVLFQQIWKRPGAPGEINYFEKRLKDGSITDTKDLEVKLRYWFGVVYPDGFHLNEEGDRRWQFEKEKYS